MSNPWSIITLLWFSLRAIVRKFHWKRLAKFFFKIFFRYCIKVKNLFKSLGVSFKVIELDEECTCHFFFFIFFYLKKNGSDSLLQPTALPFKTNWGNWRSNLQCLMYSLVSEEFTPFVAWLFEILFSPILYCAKASFPNSKNYNSIKHLLFYRFYCTVSNFQTLLGKNHVGGSDGKLKLTANYIVIYVDIYLIDTHAAKASGKLKSLLDQAGVKSNL